MVKSVEIEQKMSPLPHELFKMLKTIKSKFYYSGQHFKCIEVIHVTNRATIRVRKQLRLELAYLSLKWKYIL